MYYTEILLTVLEFLVPTLFFLSITYCGGQLFYSELYKIMVSKTL